MSAQDKPREEILPEATGTLLQIAANVPRLIKRIANLLIRQILIPMPSKM